MGGLVRSKDGGYGRGRMSSIGRGGVIRKVQLSTIQVDGHKEPIKGGIH